MRRFQCALFAPVAAIGFASVASAADMPVKARPVPVAVAYNWTGFYAGVNGGYAFGDSVGPITFNTSFGPTFTTTGSTFDAKGGFGGVQVGYNWQTGQIVLGIEADIQAAAIKSDISGGVTGFADTYSGNRNLNYFGTARGRIGYAVDRTLLYVSGGFAYGGLKESIIRTNVGAAPWVVSAEDNAGFVVGGGAECAFAPAWSAKVEYQYIDFGRRSLAGVYQGTTFTLQSNDLNQHYSTVRLGLNYKFFRFH